MCPEAKATAKEEKGGGGKTGYFCSISLPFSPSHFPGAYIPPSQAGTHHSTWVKAPGIPPLFSALLPSGSRFQAFFLVCPLSCPAVGSLGSVLPFSLLWKLLLSSFRFWRLKVPVPSKLPLTAFIFAVFLYLSPQTTFLPSVLSSLSLVPGRSSLQVGVFASQAGGSELRYSLWGRGTFIPFNSTVPEFEPFRWQSS